MSELSITLVCTPGETLKVHCVHESRVADAECPLPPQERMLDLLQQATDGHSPGALRALAQQLGELLFVGEAGALARDALQDDPDCAVLLGTDPRLSSWPWELARDPETGRAPVLEGAGFVRVGGEPTAVPKLPSRGVLVVPEALGQARVTALQSSTRHLARKAGLDIFPAEPATGPGLRRTLMRGAVMAHVEAVDEKGWVALDDGAVPIERLGLAEDTWLAVLGGTENTSKAATRLREAGVHIVLAHQLELRPNEAAAVDRELYRALAGGTPLFEAVRRVRRALLRTAGEDACTWAAPVLWSAPADSKSLAPALEAFPPPGIAEHDPGFGVTVPSMDTVAASRRDAPAYPDLVGPPGHPQPAPIFVHETVRRIRAAGEGVDDPELDSRTAALRALGGSAQSKDGEASLDPDERTARLADRLVAAIGRADLPLQLPAELGTAVARGSKQAAVGAVGIRQAARALAAGPVVWLAGPPGAGKQRLARLLAEEIFGYHPRLVRGDSGEPIMGGPWRGPEGAVGGGWLYRTVVSNWLRDELDALHPAQPEPTTRMRLVSRAEGGGFATYEGGWLVVLSAHRAPADEIRRLIAACHAGVLEGISEDGSNWRVPVPADFRVLLCGRTPELLPGGVPVIQVEPARQAATERDRWVAAAEVRVGPAGDSGETLERRRMAEAIAAVVRFARVVSPMSGEVGAAALAYAIESSSELDAAVDEALCLYLWPQLSGLGARHAGLLRAFVSSTPDEVFDATLLDPENPDDLQVVLRLARYLDREAPAEQQRSAALARRMAEGNLDLGPLLGEWRERGGLPATEVLLPQLSARLLGIR